jgi:hypothetical protein
VAFQPVNARLTMVSKLIWLTRDIIEVWLEHAGLEAASHNYASAAGSVLAMWLSLNSRSV